MTILYILWYLTQWVHADDTKYDLLFQSMSAADLQNSSLDGVTFYGTVPDGRKELHMKKTIEYIELAKKFKPEYSSACRADGKLNIYFLPGHIINSREIMHFLAWSKWDNKNIFGAFDSTYSHRELYPYLLGLINHRK